MPYKYEPMVQNQKWKWSYEQAMPPTYQILQYQPQWNRPNYQSIASHSGNDGGSNFSWRGLFVGLGTVGVVVAGAVTGGLAIGAAVAAGTIGAGTASALGSGVVAAAGAVGVVQLTSTAIADGLMHMHFLNRANRHQ